MPPEDTTTTDTSQVLDVSTSSVTQADTRDYETEISDLRQEAKKYRLQLRETQKQVKTLQPAADKLAELDEASKGESEKMAERLVALEGQLSKATASAERATNERRLTVLATKAGVAADVLQFLDVSKFDLEDEEATIKALSALVPVAQSNSGASSNPARSQPGGDAKVGYDGLTSEEWMKGAGRKSYIFGEK